MNYRSDRIVEFIRRYGLAAACVVAPLVLSLGVFSVAQQALIPVSLHPNNENRVVFHYEPAKPSDQLAVNEQAAAAKPGTVTTSLQQRVLPDEAMFLPAFQYAGRASYAIVSSFLFVASLTTLIFASVIIYQKLFWKGVLGIFLLWAVVASVITLMFDNPHGRYLIVRDLLNAADNFDGLQKFVFYWKDQFPWVARNNYVPTGVLAEAFVHANTIISLIPVGMLLTALALMSIRNSESKTEMALKARLMKLRCALLLASTCFVIGVLCNKSLVEWPLQLVRLSQAKALRPIADSLVLQFGAIGTTAIFAAFAPAIIAWMLDVNAMTAEASPRRRVGGVAKRGASAKDDTLIFAPMATVTAVVAVLAPVLASPVVDSLKLLAGALSK